MAIAIACALGLAVLFVGVHRLSVFAIANTGGIEIHIAAEQPTDVQAENWLPITREDVGIDVIMRVYVPDLTKKIWKTPKAELVR